MNSHFLNSLFFLITTISLGQIKFERGYFIDNKNIKKVNSSSTKVITLTVDVEGVGRTFKEAVKDGLLQAISQVNGTQISSETKSMINTFESSQNDSDQSLGTESFQEKIKQKTNGVIQKWNIISKTKSDNGSFNKVNLKVYISKLKLSDDLKK